MRRRPMTAAAAAVRNVVKKNQFSGLIDRLYADVTSPAPLWVTWHQHGGTASYTDGPAMTPGVYNLLLLQQRQLIRRVNAEIGK